MPFPEPGPPRTNITVGLSACILFCWIFVNISKLIYIN